MQDKELIQIWKSYDQKLDQVLTLNKTLARELTKQQLNKTIGRLKLPKQILLVLGIPYALLLCLITWITYQAGAFMMMLGFGMIGLLMIGIIIGYVYHLYLIAKIRHTEEIVEVQKRMAQLKISSFNIARLAILQLPFWSICWISWDGLTHSPWVYGGVNLLVFLALSYLTYWLYQNLSLENSQSKVSQLIFSGREWEPLLKSSDILAQLKEYQ